MKLPQVRMAMNPIRFLESHVDSPTGMVELAGGPVRKVLVWHPETVEWLFHSDARLRHPGGRTLTPMFGERSLVWAEGERHSEYRRVLGPPLRGKGLLDQHGVIDATVHAAVDALAPGAVVDVLAWTRAIALRVIAGLLLGRYDEDLLSSVTRWIDRAFGARLRTLGYRYLMGGLPRSDPEMDARLVAAAKASRDLRPRTLAARLLEHGAPGGLDGSIEDVEVRDAVTSLLFAGHETTAAGAAWTLYWLDRNPRVRDEIRDELAGGGDGADAARVPLLQAAVCEALRLSPPATLAEHRVLVVDAAPPGGCPGRTLRAGTMLTPAIYTAHRHPDAFPDPLRFDPGRFLAGRPSPYHYFPFGGGTRFCLGNQLAQLEIRMITAALLRRREWRAVRPRAGVTRMRGNILAPAGLRMRVLSCRD
jgi:cytochrome P450 family 110